MVLKLVFPSASCDLLVFLRESETVTKSLGLGARKARFLILGIPKLVPEVQGAAVNIAAVFMGCVFP